MKKAKLKLHEGRWYWSPSHHIVRPISWAEAAAMLKVTIGSVRQ